MLQRGDSVCTTAVLNLFSRPNIKENVSDRRHVVDSMTTNYCRAITCSGDACKTSGSVVGDRLAYITHLVQTLYLVGKMIEFFHEERFLSQRDEGQVGLSLIHLSLA